MEDFLDRIVHPEDRGTLTAAVAAALEHGTPYEFDLRVVLPDRGLRWLHARARAVRGPDGRTERITGLLSDVTERRQREEALAFLDAASQVLAASVDPVETLEEVARLAVPRLADWCAVQLVADRRERLRAGRGRPRRPGQGPLGARSSRSATRPIRTRRPARPP